MQRKLKEHNTKDTYISLGQAVNDLELLFSQYFNLHNESEAIQRPAQKMTASVLISALRFRESNEGKSILKCLLSEEQSLLNRIKKYNDEFISEQTQPVTKAGPQGVDPVTIDTINSMSSIKFRYNSAVQNKRYEKDELPLLQQVVKAYEELTRSMNSYLIQQNKKDIQREKLILIYTDDGSLNVSVLSSYSQ
jgi:hypothetical protein